MIALLDASWFWEVSSKHLKILGEPTGSDRLLDARILDDSNKSYHPNILKLQENRSLGENVRIQYDDPAN